ncbi:hypothetical protein ADUPG1_010594, partial [Aduncisulcus paluster]
IARPMYILNLLDKSTLRGVYGFMMEFCAGGSVSDFVRDWCFSRPKIDKLPYESEGSEDDFDDLIASSPPQPDPIRIACVCVHMIECLHDVFVSRPEFIDRDIKPDNFLVRVDPISNVCTIVLGDLGLVEIRSSMTMSSHSIPYESPKKTFGPKPTLPGKHFPGSGGGDGEGKETIEEVSHGTCDEDSGEICGTFVYNSYEALKRGVHSQLSDAYSLGMSIFSLFSGKPPFFFAPLLKGVKDSFSFIKTLIFLHENDMVPQLMDIPLFQKIQTMEDGKYVDLFHILNTIFSGLITQDVTKRMSVHRANELVQSIKHLLPTLGEGWKCCSTDGLIKQKIAQYGECLPIKTILQPFDRDDFLDTPKITTWDSK